MIRLTHVKGPSFAPTLVLIPGGPGLSSRTLRSMDILSRSFSLAYVDFPGTSGVPFDRNRSFEELAQALVLSLSEIQGPMILAGHSFGGFFAAAVALLSDRVTGLICLSTPFSNECYHGAVQRFEEKKTPALLEAEKIMDRERSDRSYSNWVAEYGELYFSREKLNEGRALLLSDESSYQFYENNIGDVKRMEPLLRTLSAWSKPKLFLAEDYGMIPTDSLRKDAERGGFHFEYIPGTSHFLFFDQPQAVARSIERMFATAKGAVK